ncbi:MAG: Re/Si-specific NAD(P)(+) transhydrogenase subunit alpha [SAR202 cluster bacterium]|nr:Re/Si-specific NAD(P)(+) transhydrogenase subunit alpha [SAR202 cluster bacterium]
MKIAVPREIAPGERRVALVPQSIGKLKTAGNDVLVEAGAGAESLIPDKAFADAGAVIVPNAAEIYKSADLVVKVQRPMVNKHLNAHELDMMREGTALIAFIYPATNLDLVQKLAARKVTSFSMDTIPRTARAQSMDALSSMASIAGYRAALIAAESLAKFFPMMVTAAGTIAPAKGLVLGAGVAGLQAIATARRLGAVVSACDVRPAVKEQVESLGATFLQVQLTEQTETAGGYAKELSKESQDKARQLIANAVKEMDFVITTAAIPGRKAPILIDADMVRDMKPGAVIVDIAVETGGNCALTKAGETVVVDNVSVVGPLNLASSLSTHASQMYARNISNLLALFVKKGLMELNLADDIIKGCCITHAGAIAHEPTAALLKPSAKS